MDKDELKTILLELLQDPEVEKVLATLVSKNSILSKLKGLKIMHLLPDPKGSEYPDKHVVTKLN